MASGQLSIFGEPELKAELSQWHSPPWLCRRVAEWVQLGSRVLEPCCGGGNIIDALLRAGHAPQDVVGNEVDEAWHAHCVRRFDDAVKVYCEDFFSCASLGSFDVVPMNPPFEDEQHTAFVKRALELAPIVIAIVPASFEFGQARDRELWATRAVVTRKAKMPARVDFGGDTSGKGDTVCLKIERREQARQPGEIINVATEVWLKDAV
jgi:predicted RNA methylase